MAGLGMWYVESQWKRAQARGEGFVENAQDRRMEQLIGDPNDAPVWWMALIPMVVVLGSIMLPRAILGMADWSESDVLWLACCCSARRNRSSGPAFR
ncbi:hypothetical protein ULG90_05405 [Halopseudomonas pachastrellae]|nr:hypothetical protein ULG90_05405 [Halopseudomonas pachastrellae]